MHGVQTLPAIADGSQRPVSGVQLLVLRCVVDAGDGAAYQRAHAAIEAGLGLEVRGQILLRRVCGVDRIRQRDAMIRDGVEQPGGAAFGQSVGLGEGLMVGLDPAQHAGRLASLPHQVRSEARIVQ